MTVRMMTKKIEGSFPEDSYPCDSCKHDPEPWDSEACDGCCKAHSGYEPKDSSTDCISREAVIEILNNYGCTNKEGDTVYIRNKEGLLFKDIRELPSIKPKADVDALINKIETEMSWYMFDEWGNTTDLHDQLVGIIRESFGEVSE